MPSRGDVSLLSNSSPFLRRVWLSLVLAAVAELPRSVSVAQAEEPSVKEGEKKAQESAEPERGVPSLPPVVVSASPLEQSLLEYSRPASVMRGQQLEERIQSTLGETIDLQPGVRSSFFGAGASRPVIRGFGGERVRTLRNGVSTGDVSNVSDDHVVVADPLEAEQIEILRGPETLLYGSSAIGGAVNVTDGSIPEFSLGKPFEGSVLGQFGNSADNEKSEAVRLRGETGTINWYGSAFSRKTDAYEIPVTSESAAVRGREAEADAEGHDDDHHEEHDELLKVGEKGESSSGIVRDTDTKTFGGTIGVSHVFDEGFVGVSVSGFDSSYGVPGHSHGEEGHEEHSDSEEDHAHDEGSETKSSHGSHKTSTSRSMGGLGGSSHTDLVIGQAEEDADSVRIEAQQTRADLRGRYDTNGAIESIRFRMGATNYEHTEFEGGEVGTVFAKEGVEARADFAHRSLGPVSGVVGLHTIYDDFSPLGEAAFIPQTKSLTQALFLFEEIKASPTLSLQGGMRLETVSHDPVGTTMYDAQPISASGGFRWDLDREGVYSLSSSLAYSERAASPIELYADGIHYARRIRERGNSSLSEERSTGIDLALRKNTGFITASVTPFYQYFHDYINLRGLEGPEREFPLYTYENIGASFWGGEFVSTLHVDELVPLCGHRFSLDLQTDIVRARDRDRDSYVPRTPPLRNIVRARWEHPKAVQLMVEGVMVEDQKRLAAEEIPTDGYKMVNSEVSYRIGEAPRSIRLFLRGTNLTNEEARVHTSFLKDFAPLRGRSFLVGFRGTF